VLPDASPPMNAFFLRTGAEKDLRFAVDLAGSAVAVGEGVLIALFEAAVATVARLPAGGRLGTDLEAAQALARVSERPFEIVACSRAVDDAGLDPDEVEADTPIDAVLGMPAIWRRVSGARIIVIG
jgi:hypothetical protein